MLPTRIRGYGESGEHSVSSAASRRARSATDPRRKKKNRHTAIAASTATTMSRSTSPPERPWPDCTCIVEASTTFTVAP